jgi:phospholipase/lecithinase/hemolysin
MSIRKIAFSLVFGLAVGITFPAAVQAEDFPFQQFVVFGDSLSDTGNDFIATSAFGVPTPASPPYDRGRFTDGPGSTPSSSIAGVWHEQLANQLGLAPATPYLGSSTGTNYAFGGATTGGTGIVPNVQTQVGLFLSGNAPSSNSLYIFWGGANDLLNAGSASDINSAATNAVKNIAGDISTLAGAGAKNFLWVDLPPLNSVPRTQGSPLNSALGTASVSFNTQMAAAIQQLQSSFPGIAITDVDVYSLFTSLLANPGAGGFTNVTTPAIGTNVNPDTYLFWDDLHPTSAGHQAVANLALSDLDATYADLTASPEPATAGIFLLIGGLVGLVKLKRVSRCL